MYSGVLELKESQILFSFGVFMSISPKRICHHTVVYSYRNILCFGACCHVSTYNSLITMKQKERRALHCFLTPHDVYLSLSPLNLSSLAIINDF
jgi:hypothetical protein